MTNIERLRRLMAEIMGWRYVPASGAMNQDFYENIHEDFIFWAEEGVRKEPIWRPDERIDQAFMVVEKMREKGWVFMLDNEGPWDAIFWHIDVGGAWVHHPPHHYHLRAWVRSGDACITSPFF